MSLFEEYYNEAYRCITKKSRGGRPTSKKCRPGVSGLLLEACVRGFGEIEREYGGDEHEGADRDTALAHGERGAVEEVARGEGAEAREGEDEGVGRRSERRREELGRHGPEDARAGGGGGEPDEKDHERRVGLPEDAGEREETDQSDDVGRSEGGDAAEAIDGDEGQEQADELGDKNREYERVVEGAAQVVVVRPAPRADRGDDERDAVVGDAHDGPDGRRDGCAARQSSREQPELGREERQRLAERHGAP
mmetsp:Transcript_3914/g.15591  ORF Transcript_3914/g.15591 Transcript_3914/m.15591 type:complete len:251 (+) Transcript_3914:1959-2711(+)